MSLLCCKSTPYNNKHYKKLTAPARKRVAAFVVLNPWSILTERTPDLPAHTRGTNRGQGKFMPPFSRLSFHSVRLTTMKPHKKSWGP